MSSTSALSTVVTSPSTSAIQDATTLPTFLVPVSSPCNTTVIPCDNAKNADLQEIIRLELMSVPDLFEHSSNLTLSEKVDKDVVIDSLLVSNESNSIIEEEKCDTSNNTQEEPLTTGIDFNLIIVIMYSITFS